MRIDTLQYVLCTERAGSVCRVNDFIQLSLAYVYVNFVYERFFDNDTKHVDSPVVHHQTCCWSAALCVHNYSDDNAFVYTRSRTDWWLLPRVGTLMWSVSLSTRVPIWTQRWRWNKCADTIWSHHLYSNDYAKFIFAAQTDNEVSRYLSFTTEGRTNGSGRILRCWGCPWVGCVYFSSVHLAPRHNWALWSKSKQVQCHESGSGLGC